MILELIFFSSFFLREWGYGAGKEGKTATYLVLEQNVAFIKSSVTLYLCVDMVS